MLILKRVAASILVLAGVFAPYLANAWAAVGSAEATASAIALALGCLALAGLLWRDWDGVGRRRDAARAEPAPRTRWFAAFAALAIVASGAAAQKVDAETPGERAACLSSVLRLCPAEALAADKLGAKRCLLRNVAQASPECRAVIRAGAARDQDGLPARPITG